MEEAIIPLIGSFFLIFNGVRSDVFTYTKVAISTGVNGSVVHYI